MATDFLKERKVLSPSDYTIERLIQAQREKARTATFAEIAGLISPELKHTLDDLLTVDSQYSKLYQIKEVPRKPSVAGMKLLANKLTLIEQTGALRADLGWLNNNYKRYLSAYVTRCDAKRLRELEPLHRYAVLVCFLQEAYQTATDHIFDMYQKALNAMYTKADNAIADYNRSKHTVTRSCLSNHKKLCKELLALADGKTDIAALFQKYPSISLQARIIELDALLTGRYSNNLNLVADRFSQMRQLAKPLLEQVSLELAPTGNTALVTALQTVREIVQGTRRTVPPNADLSFLPKSIAATIREKDGINRRRYEVAVLTSLRDHIKSGNLSIQGSKRFGQLDNFFMPTERWAQLREGFFEKADLPLNPEAVPRYLERRLQRAFDTFLSQEQSNTFARVNDDGWLLSKDPAEELTSGKQQGIERLSQWLTEHMRTIKLPDLLIEVDNDLHFTNVFLPATRRNERAAEDVCAIITTLMAYGCNIGPHLMAQIIRGSSYKQIKHIFDWQITDDAQR